MVAPRAPRVNTEPRHLPVGTGPISWYRRFLGRMTRRTGSTQIATERVASLVAPGTSAQR